ncbi:hypothetical protein A0H81_10882 [Grifola frondosa]|uniref:BTB domain-containing protein n=1 Tax=Grifola frondosa TaxID=5627 RepID=A0A1C7M2I1_GRIFR|nr:hypothetical protein A0H81_10882 [Grifola frondosa]
MDPFWRRLLPRTVTTLVSTTTLAMANDNTVPAEHSSVPRRHPRYWLEDGSLVIRSQNDLFKVHRTLLHRHSPVLSSLHGKDPTTSEIDGCPVVHISEDLDVQSEDLEALLEHLYHDAFECGCTLSAGCVYPPRIFPAAARLPFNTYSRAQEVREHVPSDPEAFLHPEHADHALTLAIEFDVRSIQKALYYSLATNANLEHGDADGTVTPLSSRPNISPEVMERCTKLLNQLVDHFTPILFTVATAHHMECTDVFAEAWMPLVIQPALESNGLCCPLETLQTIIELDWAAHGLCAECVKDKREEWRGEQQDVWDKMDEWLGLNSKKS